MRHQTIFSNLTINVTNISLIILIINLLVNETQSKKCRVLALEGGGDKGAFQVGAINGLITNLPPEEVQWDVITGVSIASYNAAVLAHYEIGDEKAASEDLLTQWRSINRSNIYQNWNYGPIYGLLYSSGLFDNSVERDFIMNHINKLGDFKRDYIIGATNVKTGTFDTFTNKDFKNITDLISGIQSSGAFVSMFPFGKFNNTVYMDGGVKFNLDIPSGIHKCEDKGFKHEDIIIDVVLCSNSSLPIENPESLSPIGSYFRYTEISSYDQSMGIIEDVKYYFQNITLRYVVAPTRRLPSSFIPLNFSPADLELMIKFGQEDAKTIIDMGESIHIDYLLNIRREEKRARYINPKLGKNELNQNNCNEVKLDSIDIVNKNNEDKFLK